jgi:hypothetical protein
LLATLLKWTSLLFWALISYFVSDDDVAGIDAVAVVVVKLFFSGQCHKIFALMFFA